MLLLQDGYDNSTNVRSDASMREQLDQLRTQGGSDTQVTVESLQEQLDNLN